VVRDLQDVELRQPAGEQGRVHVVLGITGEQEPAPVHLAQQDDRRVVDAAPGVGRFERHRAGFRPQDAEADLVEPDEGAGSEGRARRAVT